MVLDINIIFNGLIKYIKIFNYVYIMGIIILNIFNSNICNRQQIK